jgi:hypothetical protein
MIPQSAPTSSFLKSPSPHVHLDSETCPWCEQEIPPEKLEEISGKITAREREQTHAITAKLEQQYEIEKAQADAKAKADLDVERNQSAAREAAAREETRIAVEAVAGEKLAAAEHSRHELQVALQKQVEESESARKVAEQAGVDLQAQLQQLRQENETALATAKADAEARETQIRTEVQQAAEAAKLAASESARLESEAALQARIAQAEETKVAAEQQRVALQLQLDELHKAKEAEAIRIRQEATEAAEGLVRDTIADKDKAVADAQAKIAEAEGKLSKLSEQYELARNERLCSQREILEKAKDDAINAEQAKFFAEKQKLTSEVNDLQRKLANMTAAELGEGAEIDLFEALKKEFPNDRIERVAKGAPGADILHGVMQNGRECGTIIYDSKNHKAFRNDHVTKLREDQLAAKAEHAILSTHKFPAGASQLHMQDGVLLANPARVVSVVTLIRGLLVQSHTLRLSSTERESKTAALYGFITSERFAQRLSQVDVHAEELLDQLAKEIKRHNDDWNKRGVSIRAIQKVPAELTNEISRIIGTAPDTEVILEESEL